LGSNKSANAVGKFSFAGISSHIWTGSMALIIFTFGENRLDPPERSECGWWFRSLVLVVSDSLAALIGFVQAFIRANAAIGRIYAQFRL